MFQNMQINLIYHINRMKNRNHMISLTDAEERYIIKFPFMIKILNKLGTGRIYLNMIQDIHD